MPREPRHERFFYGRQSARRLRSGTRALHLATTTTATTTTTTKCYSCATTAITTSTTTSTKIIGFE